VSINEPVIYYRLRQVDFDGKTTSYDPIAIKLSTVNSGFNVTVYPNPVVNTIQLQIENGQSGNIDIVIYDISGTAVARKNVAVEKGMTSVSIDNLDALAGGIYFMYATLNGNVYKQKLLKNAN
jgi:hypothetical protein